MNITKCCLIGVDETTNLDELEKLYDTSTVPLEFGVLYSPKLAGYRSLKDIRYPSIEFIEVFAERFKDREIAIHLCGDAVNYWIDYRKDIMEICDRYKRVQVNFNLSKFDPLQLVHLLIIRLYETPIPVILQYNKSKQKVMDDIISYATHRDPLLCKNLHILFDASGGLGRVANKFGTTIDNLVCGYAGGMNPDNMEEILANIYTVNKLNPFYVDMESGIRTDDKFDLNKCRKIIEIVNKHSI